MPTKSVVARVALHVRCQKFVRPARLHRRCRNSNSLYEGVETFALENCSRVMIVIVKLPPSGFRTHIGRGKVVNTWSPDIAGTSGLCVLCLSAFMNQVFPISKFHCAYVMQFLVGHGCFLTGYPCIACSQTIIALASKHLMYLFRRVWF